MDIIYSGKKALNQAIAALEVAKDAPNLVRLKDFIANASKSNPEMRTSNR